jgi:hypothetical protein
MKVKLLLSLASAWAVAGTVVFGDSITPSGNPLTPISGATYGGTGNPNDAEVTTLTSGNETITLGLQAQQRYFNPALANDNAGTFSATTGANYGNPANPSDTTYSTTLGATWNFDFYINVAGGSFGGATFDLLIANGGTIYTFDLNTAYSTTSATTTLQDSENLDFASIATAIGGFNPNASGVYGFELEELNSDKTVIASTAINVDVNAVPDVTSTALLLGLGLGALVVFGYRQKRLQTA